MISHPSIAKAPPLPTSIPLFREYREYAVKVERLAQHCRNIIAKTHEIKIEKRFEGFDHNLMRGTGKFKSLILRIAPDPEGLLQSKDDFEKILIFILKQDLGDEYQRVVKAHKPVQKGYYIELDLDGLKSWDHEKLPENKSTKYIPNNNGDELVNESSTVNTATVSTTNGRCEEDKKTPLAEISFKDNLNRQRITKGIPEAEKTILPDLSSVIEEDMPKNESDKTPAHNNQEEMKLPLESKADDAFTIRVETPDKELDTQKVALENPLQKTTITTVINQEDSKLPHIHVYNVDKSLVSKLSNCTTSPVPSLGPYGVPFPGMKAIHVYQGIDFSTLKVLSIQRRPFGGEGSLNLHHVLFPNYNKEDDEGEWKKYTNIQITNVQIGNEPPQDKVISAVLVHNSQFSPELPTLVKDIKDLPVTVSATINMPKTLDPNHLYYGIKKIEMLNIILPSSKERDQINDESTVEDICAVVDDTIGEKIKKFSGAQ